MPPRIEPGDRSEIGWRNWAIANGAGLAAKGSPPRIFTTLGRHRRLFRAWIRFAGALMPRGKLPRDETELVILRVAHNSGSDYEWSHHERLGKRAGLSEEEISRVREGPQAPGWSPRRAMLLRAADQMHADRVIARPLWDELAAELDDVRLIELCMLIGHYEMLAMTLNTLEVEPERPGRL
ncbi:MAG TPA: carboxymuconolactone decarboxylase family protein [Solirubrobacterales bacterium]